ncbi:pyridoxamine 5'-phosphate oxidase family protein [Bacillus paralicheniformis]|uniref:pyridoxamine 5'-phosphate oxidase family protein n=1 Tax=Bacillus paralicheniformis TaxID=1648923 RepID=UPI0013EF3E72|nr:pyridoxamine 5'-phosphate oxidase family protein [Bacillus paralicheniformis]QII47608.1 pyridoxamine 5'-phosphate oxidase family protein [Bacillus paralicheniformis]
MAQLSNELFQLINGEKLAGKRREAMMLQTVTEDGWPHTAMISAGEILALNKTDIRLALWQGTTTTANIARTGRALLVTCWKGKAYYVRLSLKKLPELKDAKHPRARFAGTVEAAREDIAKYADIISGVQIELKDEAAVLRRWEETLEELRK